MEYDLNISDEELFQLVKKSNSNALKVLFKKYYQNLCYFSFSYVKEKQIAEEVVSDIFIKLWEKRAQINIGLKLKSYLYTAVKNQSLNYLRSNKLHSEKLNSVDQITLTMIDNPDDNLRYEDLKKVMDNLIETLPDKRKLIFRMNKFDELSYEEIASILSISISTVRNQMVSAVKYLNKQYTSLKKIISLLIIIFI